MDVYSNVKGSNMNKEKTDFLWNIIKSKELVTEQPFFYAVKTTGIFCRPGCSSRLPNKENIEYFDNVTEAQKAGYRECKRCKPILSSQNHKLLNMIISICREIEEADETLNLSDLSVKRNYSPWHLQKLFKEITGLSPKEYSDSLKKNRFINKLSSSLSITDAIYNSGFGSSSRVYEKSRQWLAMKPSEYKKGAPSLNIHFGISQCVLGYVLVAFTEKGICAIDLGDDPILLEESFLKRFFKAHISNTHSKLNLMIEGVIRLINHPEIEQKLPLDIQGTIFQEKVWKALREIPPGETRTYAEIASFIEQPKSARAVANACGANKLAIAIPCHRVIRSDGSPGGYHWGLERKKVLLERESNSRTK